MHTGRAVDRCDFVAQRGTKDCVIAAIATVIIRTYDEVAEELGISVDPDSGLRAVAGGIHPLDTIFPLLRMGWLAALLPSREAPNQNREDRSRFATSDQIKEVLRGHRAVVGYTDPDPRVGEHALAWDGSRAIDCSNGEYVCLGDVIISCALLLTPLPQGSVYHRETP